MLCCAFLISKYLSLFLRFVHLILYNIIWHIINFMSCIFNFIVQVIILFNFMVHLINCMYLFHFVVIHIIIFTLLVFPFRCI